jgi:hypothetical protein
MPGLDLRHVSAGAPVHGTSPPTMSKTRSTGEGLFETDGSAIDGLVRTERDHEYLIAMEIFEGREEIGDADIDDP